MSKEDGGPAHPVQPDARFPGMTLRDYFAAKAMQAIWSNTEVLRLLGGSKDDAEQIAELAYAQANAMLKERAK